MSVVCYGDRTSAGWNTEFMVLWISNKKTVLRTKEEYDGKYLYAVYYSMEAEWFCKFSHYGIQFPSIKSIKDTEADFWNNTDCSWTKDNKKYCLCYYSPDKYIEISEDMMEEVENPFSK